MNAKVLLLADDDRLVRVTLASGLRNAGYHVVEAEDGEQALAQCLQQPPDLAIFDICMPGMSGLEVASELSKKAIDVPTIFLSAYSDKEKVQAAVKEGALGYMVKPVDTEKLLPEIETSLQQATIKNIQKMEQDLTERLLSSLAPPTGLVSNNIRWICRPASIASGDLILTAQTPDNAQRLLLGDVTGHGLNAALAGMLAPGIFYGMTSGGRSAADVLTALNCHIYSQLPADIFMCACMLELSENRRTLKIWNRGLPDVLICNSEHGVRQQIKSDGLALGVSNGQNYESVTIVSLYENDRIYLYSDGVTELRNNQDKFFGYTGVEDLLNTTPSSSFNNIVDNLNQFQGDALQIDDITLVEISCTSAIPLSQANDSNSYNQNYTG